MMSNLVPYPATLLKFLILNIFHLKMVSSRTLSGLKKNTKMTENSLSYLKKVNENQFYWF